MRRKIGHPRFIDPSLVEIGDKISVEHAEVKGIVTINNGVVANRLDQGYTRRFITAEGAVLLAWNIKANNSIRVTLLEREEPENATLFDQPHDFLELTGRWEVA